MTTLLIHAGSTLAMAGVIWLIQLVHYPLFALASQDRFAEFAAQHQKRISWVVVPLMLAELGSAAWLLLWPYPGLSDTPMQRVLLWLGLVLLAIVWLSTALLQVPLHRRLGQGFDPDAVRRLVNTNWVRTFGWSARAGIVLALLATALS